MVMSEQLSSSTSCMLFTLLLWLPVLTEVLGMEWLLPRLFILQLAALFKNNEKNKVIFTVNIILQDISNNSVILTRGLKVFTSLMEIPERKMIASQAGRKCNSLFPLEYPLPMQQTHCVCESGRVGCNPLLY